MMYRVISAFNDLLDGGFLYKSGAAYPREGAPNTATSEKRIAELLGSENRQHKPLIERVEAKVEQPVRKKRGKKNETV